jgi:hypothetical protein
VTMTRVSSGEAGRYECLYLNAQRQSFSPN